MSGRGQGEKVFDETTGVDIAREERDRADDTDVCLKHTERSVKSFSTFIFAMLMRELIERCAVSTWSAFDLNLFAREAPNLY